MALVVRSRQVRVDSELFTSSTQSRPCWVLHHRVDTPLNWKNRSIELCHGETEARENAGFPVLGKSFFGEHRSKIIHPPTKNGQHCRRTR